MQFMLILNLCAAGFLISFSLAQQTTLENDVEFDLSSSEMDPLLDPGRFLNITPPEPPKVYPSFITGSVKSLHGQLFTSVFNLLLKKGLFFNTEQERQKPAHEFKTPDELKEVINFKIEENGLSHDELIGMLEKVLQYSPHPSHPFRLSRESSGLNTFAMIGDMFASSMTNVLLTYYAAPVYTLMELELTRKLRALVGYENGEGDGVTTPGGAFANILALQVVLRKKVPETKYHGIINSTKSLIIFISEDAAQSFEKVVAFEGFPADWLVRIKTDKYGRMDAMDLETQILKCIANETMTPLMVVATAGTSVLGAIDPIEQIANLCSEKGIWLHVDASQGGPILLSEKQRHRLAGVNRSDSFIWSASQLLGVPQTSSFLLTREADILENTFSYGAKYVFAKSQLYNQSYDQGDKTVQTARRPDVLKTWLMWKGLGQQGLEAHIDQIYKSKDTFIQLAQNMSSSFELVLQDFDLPIISFFYVPTQMKAERQSEDFPVKLTKFTEELKNTLLLHGGLGLSVSSHKNFPSTSFLTLSLCNSALDSDDLGFILAQIQHYGELIQTRDSPTTITPPVVPKPKPTFLPFVSVPISELHRSFIVDSFQLLLRKGLFFQTKRKDPPRRFRTPEALSEIFDRRLSLGDSGSSGAATDARVPMSQNDLINEMGKVLDFSGHHSHPFWVYQLFTGLNPYSLIGDYIVSALKPDMMSYESSPVFTLAEQEVLSKIRSLIGYPEDGDGLVNPGGSFSNILAMALARFHKFPKTRKGGMLQAETKKLVLYASIDAHYSFNKGAFLLGLGLENCVMIKADERGRMSVPHLVEEIKKTLSEGGTPFMVVGTAGTTVLGSIDPLDQIGKVADEYGMWFHVDAVFGGGLIMSSKYRDRLKGVELSDSFAVNAHKMFAAAMTISCLVTKHKGITQGVFGSPAQTVVAKSMQSSKLYDQELYDLGDRHILGQRSSNVFKFWLLWKAQGMSGLANHIDYVMDNAKYAVEQLKERSDAFELIIPEFELTNVCFLYIPKQFRMLNRTSDVFRTEMAPVADKLQVLLIQNGIMDIVVQTAASKDTPTFMKLVLMSSTTTKEDIKYLLDQIDFYGQNL